MRTYCTAQETLLSALWGPKWEGNLKKELYVYTTDSLLCTAGTNNIVKQLYSDKINLK